MKIVYFASSQIPSRTANSIHVMKMCQAMAMLGHEVTLLAPDNKSRKECAEEFGFYGVERCFKLVKLPWVKKIPGKGYLYGFLAAVYAKKIKPDLIYGRNLCSCFFSVLFNSEVVFESHSPIKGTGQFPYFMFRFISINSRLLGIVVISEGLKKHYVSSKVIKEEKIFIAADGADLLPISVNQLPKTETKSRFSVGYIGHLYPGRGIDLILNLAKLCQWADFHVVGGNDIEICYWKEASAEQSNLIFHGFVIPKDLVKYYGVFDVMIAPYQDKVSDSGGTNTVKWMSPLKIFEYMAAKKPILTSKLPALMEVLKDDYTALLCDPADIFEWKSALNRLHESNELCERLSMNAYKVLKDNYTWSKRAERILQFIEFRNRIQSVKEIAR